MKESFSKTYDAHFKNCWGRICQCWPVHIISEFHCLFLVVEVQKSFSCNRLLRTRLEVHLLKAMAARHGASQQEPSSTWVSYISLFKKSGRIGLDVIWCYPISSKLTLFLETRCWFSSCFIVLQELSDLWLLPSNACGQEQLQHSGELWETWWGDANVALHCVPSWEIAFHSADSLNSLNWLACVLPASSFPAIWQIERPWLPWKNIHEIRRYIAVGSYALIFWSREAALLEASDCELLDVTCNQIQDKASQTCQVCLLTNEILNAVFKKFSTWLLGKEVGWCCEACEL